MTMSTVDHAMDTTESALHLTDVCKRFSPDGEMVLEDINLDVSRGSFVAIVGPSGCGKTTLLRIIQGLEEATSGSVLHGARTKNSRMSYVFQRASLLPWSTVRRNVTFGLDLAAGQDVYSSKNDSAEAIDELLRLTGLTQYADYYPSQISGGMQQRVNVARALAVQPDVLLLDEPFSALDALTRERLQVDVSEILSRLSTTAILVTHDIREAVFMADRVVILRAHPGAVQEMVAIPHERPRDVGFQHSDVLANLERDIWALLNQ